MYGYYTHPTPGADGAPVVVRLLANPEDRAALEAKGFTYLVPAPPPGTSTPEEEAAGLEKAQEAAAKPAAPSVPRPAKA